MITFPNAEWLVDPRERNVSVSLPCPSPVRQGQVDVWLSREPNGPPARGSMVRVLVVRDGTLPAYKLLTKDVLAEWPRGGPAHLVVRYAGRPVGTGPVRLLVVATM